jgi:hypothetical protein
MLVRQPIIFCISQTKQIIWPLLSVTKETCRCGCQSICTQSSVHNPKSSKQSSPLQPSTSLLERSCKVISSLQSDAWLRRYFEWHGLAWGGASVNCTQSCVRNLQTKLFVHVRQSQSDRGSGCTDQRGCMYCALWAHLTVFGNCTSGKRLFNIASATPFENELSLQMAHSKAN